MSVTKKGKKWQASASIDGKRTYLGTFPTKKAGQAAIDKARQEAKIEKETKAQELEHEEKVLFDDLQTEEQLADPLLDPADNSLWTRFKRWWGIE